jgi:hypothetical protein
MLKKLGRDIDSLAVRVHSLPNVTVVNTVEEHVVCEMSITDGLEGVGHTYPPECQVGTDPTTGPPVPDAFKWSATPHMSGVIKLHESGTALILKYTWASSTC